MTSPALEECLRREGGRFNFLSQFCNPGVLFLVWFNCSIYFLGPRNTRKISGTLLSILKGRKRRKSAPGPAMKLTQGFHLFLILLSTWENITEVAIVFEILYIYIIIYFFETKLSKQIFPSSAFISPSNQTKHPSYFLYWIIEIFILNDGGIYSFYDITVCETFF